MLVSNILTSPPDSLAPSIELSAPDTLPHHMVLDHLVERQLCLVEREYGSRGLLHIHGFKPRQRILLYGPSGCGKTLAASRLAWTTGLPLLKVRFDAWATTATDSPKILREAFKTSLESPHLLLLDECDFLGRDTIEENRLTDTLVRLMRDYDPPGLLVVTTGTRQSARGIPFDDIIEIPAPRRGDVVLIMQETLSVVPVDPDICWRDATKELFPSTTKRYVRARSSAEVIQIAANVAKAVILSGAGDVRAHDIQRQIRSLEHASTC